MLQKLISYGLAKAKKSRVVLNLFEKPINLSSFPVTGSFTDRHGNQFTLREGLRSRIKPGWQSYFEHSYNTRSFDKKMAEQQASNGRRAVEKIESLINCFAGGVSQKSVLEIGCNSGAATYAFSEKGASKVVGTDFVEYKTTSDNNVHDSVVDNYLSQVRDLVKQCFKPGCQVQFRDDDICNSSLPDNTFDLVCSWDVLEHIHDPLAAFKHINRIMKKGGVAIHTYNPFFNINGGHSPCTLDFPWAHVMLDEADFLRYNSEIQPQRKDKSLSFYRNGLNRMSIKDMRQMMEEAGLQVEVVIPYIKEQYWKMVDARTLECARRNYPKITMEDLIASLVIVVARKN